MMPDTLNTSIYETIARKGISEPDIPVPHTETYGQCAEDIIVRAALEAIAFSEGLDFSQEHYLEIGANHPVATSASWLLHETLGMRGMLVEANPQLLEALRLHRDGDEIVHAAVVAHDEPTTSLFVSSHNELSSTNKEFVTQWPGDPIELRETIEVPAIRINAIIADRMGGVAPLFLSIDIEGEDLTILSDLDFTRYRPGVIQVEPSDHFHEHNSRDIADFLLAKGYTLTGRTSVNLIFVDSLRFSANKQWRQEFTSLTDSLHAVQDELQTCLTDLSRKNDACNRLQARFTELRKHFIPG
ncbi:FkbM family methyltransferase [Acetobacter fallax]|uniref:Methyltransferase FkbM domain-containing protein n=1 Tax=Acetobacter fallax TaxID=1737473 RepID=A0ABX0KDE4_9PROT|nr:FkbM family methyltransferase [Acetobacter fallax]NHO34156.1 hypothetical protein [Acetobacter fallax]NHO37705.1 hypothetical protein [Acetobacter fallax]